jgi:hypothetical protein
LFTHGKHFVLEHRADRSERSRAQNNLDFCICFQLNLCYGVYIPVDEVAKLAAFHAGSKLRHWPPGTNSKPFVPSFFVPKMVFWFSPAQNSRCISITFLLFFGAGVQRSESKSV